jgi:hypothetical protein
MPINVAMRALFCIDVDHLGKAKSLQCHGVDIVSDITKLEGRQ